MVQTLLGNGQQEVSERHRESMCMSFFSDGVWDVTRKWARIRQALLAFYTLDKAMVAPNFLMCLHKLWYISAIIPLFVAIHHGS